VKRAHGFSLMEVLLALALLGVLLLSVLGGIRSAVRSVHAGTLAVDRFDQLRSAQQFLRHDLAQARGIPWRVDDKGNPIVFEGEARRMRFVAPLPGYLDQAGPQLQTLALVDDGDGLLRLELSSRALAPDGPAALAEVAPEVLMRGLRGGSFAYYAPAAAERPGDWRGQWREAALMPAAVQVELSAAQGQPTWPRLEAPIRQHPNATNTRALARSLPNATRY
jgi:general secretion pathway protein J